MNITSNLGFWLVALAALSLLPFVLTMITSFAKLVIVGGILRQALGTQNTPPNTVITGIALILSLHIMAPVAFEAYNRYVPPKPAQKDAAVEWGAQSKALAYAVREPLHRFLSKHASESNQALFTGIQARLNGPDFSESGKDFRDVDESIRGLIHDLIILAPAFMLTEMTEAFQIGFIVFVPFVVIDLVVANILVTLGMTMLQPQTIALPLKIMIFVAIDGWRLILQGLAMNYV